MPGLPASLAWLGSTFLLWDCPRNYPHAEKHLTPNIHHLTSYAGQELGPAQTHGSGSGSFTLWPPEAIWGAGGTPLQSDSLTGLSAGGLSCWPHRAPHRTACMSSQGAKCPPKSGVPERARGRPQGRYAAMVLLKGEIPITGRTGAPPGVRGASPAWLGPAGRQCRVRLRSRLL